ncbi:GlsB/YeaQ/YmgE family stress response membrane protein [Asanoa sp. NPDC049518]|uniref:GlsB/YeaQ/YmgE family stress response membrane protein n=1 Tax=unclassified Asanoa TaxID=2685164 RepID=UPI0034462354
MQIDGVISAIVIGLVIGALGRLVLPGRQRVGFWLTLLIGIAAALVGTGIASVFGVADTDNIDWIELALQVALAAGGVALVSRRRDGQRRLPRYPSR